MYGLSSRVDGCFADANQALPTWDAVVEGATPDHIHATPTDEPSVTRGCQHVSVKVEKAFHTEAFCPSLDVNERVLVSSQSGPLAGVPFHWVPTSFATRIDSELFRTLLLRRFRLPLPFTVRVCRWGHLLDSLGHHWSVHCVRGSGPERFRSGSGCGLHSAEREWPGFRRTSWSVTSICRRYQALMSQKGCLVPVWRRPICDRCDVGQRFAG